MDLERISFQVIDRSTSIILLIIFIALRKCFGFESSLQFITSGARRVTNTPTFRSGMNDQKSYDIISEIRHRFSAKLKYRLMLTS
jgi:hypothetical protein